jgi:hypothetical protein
LRTLYRISGVWKPVPLGDPSFPAGEAFGFTASGNSAPIGQSPSARQDPLGPDITLNSRSLIGSSEQTAGDIDWTSFHLAVGKDNPLFIVGMVVMST